MVSTCDDARTGQKPQADQTQNSREYPNKTRSQKSESNEKRTRTVENIALLCNVVVVVGGGGSSGGGAGDGGGAGGGGAGGRRNEAFF